LACYNKKSKLIKTYRNNETDYVCDIIQIIQQYQLTRAGSWLARQTVYHLGASQTVLRALNVIINSVFIGSVVGNIKYIRAAMWFGSPVVCQN